MTRRRFPVGANPTRQPLQPEAIGAVMEVTKWLKPSISVSRIGDSASVQAVTRVNAEQSSKRTMHRPTRLPYRGRLARPGWMSEDYARPLHRGIGGSMYTRKARATREAPSCGRAHDQPNAGDGQVGHVRSPVEYDHPGMLPLVVAVECPPGAAAVGRGGAAASR